MRTLRVAVAQLNATVGDFAGNAAQVLAAHERANAAGADLVAYPELMLTGYPPEDLVLQPAFVDASLDAMTRLAKDLRGAVAVVGFVDRDGDAIFNAAAVVAGGRIRARYHKQALPNYGVFDEARTFTSGTELPLFSIHGVTVAITICEDLWVAGGAVDRAGRAGAECVVNINASPFHQGKALERGILVHQRAVDHRMAVIYGQLVGGQDELVFDGGSLVHDRNGKLVARGSHFEEDLVVCDLPFPDRVRKPKTAPIELAAPKKRKPTLEPHIPRLVHSPVEEVYEALLIGLRDYVRKNGFSGVVLSMSGGIDSSLVATIAADAVGPDHVLGIAMPSVHSDPRSLADAKEVATNLGIDFDVCPIASIVDAFHDSLGNVLGEVEGLAAENLQSRARGTLLMAVSNASGRLVLSCGNKSEYAVGYTTLYGDMAGGFAVLKDVPKTLVYELAAYRNAFGLTAIPEQVFTRPPTAELRPGQLDTDSLPPYEVLDPILAEIIERRASREQLIDAGFKPKVVDEVIALVARAEYKRRQAPPGVKITPLSFGRDRRVPITSRWRA